MHVIDDLVAKIAMVHKIIVKNEHLFQNIPMPMETNKNIIGSIKAVNITTHKAIEMFKNFVARTVEALPSFGVKPW